MWNRIIAATVALVVAAVAYESFSGDERKDSEANAQTDKENFSPMELEMRHVALNQPFDISVGQEVLLCDGETRGCLSFVDARGVAQFSFVLDGVHYDLEFNGSKGRVQEVGGYMIILLDFTPNPKIEIEQIYGNAYYIAKLVIANAS